MRTYPRDKWDKEEAARLLAPGWMLDLLRLNPPYVFWGPHEDYMWVKEGSGWNSAVLVEGWSAFAKDWELDDLNEVVNFYFEIGRDSETCGMCGGSGYHPDAHWVSESFYQHSSPFRARTPQEQLIRRSLEERFGFQHNEPVLATTFPSEETLAQYDQAFRAFCEAMRGGDGFWHNKITQDEVDALCASGRLYHLTSEFREGEGWVRVKPNPTAEEVNGHQEGLRSHDAINRGILVETRCKRFGIPTTCPLCGGHGQCYTAPEPHLSLVLWVIHPRKGASRGVEIKGIKREEIPATLAYLKQAARRNARRFTKAIAAARKRKW